MRFGVISFDKDLNILKRVDVIYNTYAEFIHEYSRQAAALCPFEKDIKYIVIVNKDMGINVSTKGCWYGFKDSKNVMYQDKSKSISYGFSKTCDDMHLYQVCNCNKCVTIVIGD